MNDIAGIPYFAAEFDLNGKLKSPVTLPADIDEVIVVSHGWNNNQADAESLYSGLFKNFAAIGGAPRGKAAIVGVIWPSKRFDELVAASAASNGGGGAAGLASKASKERTTTSACAATSQNTPSTRRSRRACRARSGRSRWASAPTW